MGGVRSLKDLMVERLATAGTWMDRRSLVAGLSSSPPAIEDALADLVLEELAEFKGAAGYRLRGSELARRAAQELCQRVAAAAAPAMATGQADQVVSPVMRTAVAGAAVGGEYRLGVAKRLEGPLGPQLVLFDMALPLPDGGKGFLAAHRAQLEGILRLLEGESDGVIGGR